MTPHHVDTIIQGVRAAFERAVRRDEAAAVATIQHTFHTLEEIFEREHVSEGLERIEFKQTRGPAVSFIGKLLCEEEFETRGRDPIRAIMQIWQSAAGALIAVDHTQRIDDQSTERVAVLVVKPSGNEQERRFEVMEHFGWSSRARKMVGKQLGWKLRMEVE